MFYVFSLTDIFRFLTWLGSLPFHTFSQRENHRNKTNNDNSESAVE